MAANDEPSSPDEMRSKRTSTMPTPPSAKKTKEPSSEKGNFFSRHLGHRKRRSSNVSMPKALAADLKVLAQRQSPARPQSQSSTQSQTQPPGKGEEPVNHRLMTKDGAKVDSVNGHQFAAVAAPSESTDSPTASSSGFEHHDSEQSDASSATEHDEADAVRAGSRESGIRFHIDEVPTRAARRGSSRSPRRPSIFTRSSEHAIPGVNEGVGSKARRLSTAVPRDNLVVDECPLEKHFNFFSRVHKKQIGEGGAATVYLYTSKTASEGKSKDKLFACKEFRPWEENNETKDEYERKVKSEYAIAKSLDHPNIIQTYQLCYSENNTKWNHVMEYCEPGDLTDMLRKGHFTPEDKNCMFKQLMRGVDYLHSHGIAHRDIKSENLLLTSDGCLKIADFGTSEVFSGPHPGAVKCRRPSIIAPDAPIRACEPGWVGSKPYMAPELVAHIHPYDPRSVDVWSCGIVLLSMICMGTSWAIADREKDKQYHAYATTWDEFLSKHGPKLKLDMESPLPSVVNCKAWKPMRVFGNETEPAIPAILVSMLHPDPKFRATAKEILESKPVIDMPCCQQEGYSDDIKTRQRKAMHKHCPPEKKKKKGLIPTTSG